MSYGKEISIWFLAVKYIRHKAGSFVVFKKTVSSHTGVVGEATEILQSVPVVVVLDDILYPSVAVLIATTLRLWLMASSSL